jgi:hypothetical protein
MRSNSGPMSGVERARVTTGDDHDCFAALLDDPLWTLSAGAAEQLAESRLGFVKLPDVR